MAEREKKESVYYCSFCSLGPDRTCCCLQRNTSSARWIDIKRAAAVAAHQPGGASRQRGQPHSHSPTRCPLLLYLADGTPNIWKHSLIPPTWPVRRTIMDTLSALMGLLWSNAKPSIDLWENTQSLLISMIKHCFAFPDFGRRRELVCLRSSGWCCHSP